MSTLHVPFYRNEAGLNSLVPYVDYIETTCDGEKKRFAEVFIHWTGAAWVEDAVYVPGTSVVALKVTNQCEATFAYLNYPINNFRIAQICCVDEQPCFNTELTQSLFEDTIPADSLDDEPITVGTVFKSDIAGKITHIRHYVFAQEGEAAVASLWTTGGTLLASKAFTINATGWIEVLLDVPYEITPGTLYVASVFVPSGRYPLNPAQFAVADFVNAHLTAPKTADTPDGNGVFIYSVSNTYPNETLDGNGFSVDVIFVPVCGSVFNNVFNSVFD